MKWDLWRIPIEGSEFQKLGLEVNGIQSSSIHHDGRHIAFFSHDSTVKLADVWVMEKFLPEVKAEQ